MRTLNDFKAILSTPGFVPHRLSREIAPAVIEHHGEVLDGISMKMLRLEQVAYVLVSRGADVGIVELHRDVWAGVARMYDLETDVVLAETPRTMRRLINLRAARLALRRAERKRQEAEATIRRNRRLIAEITDALPARLVERVSDSD